MNEITVKVDCSLEGLPKTEEMRLPMNRWLAIFGYNTGTEHTIILEDGEQFKGEHLGEYFKVYRKGDSYFVHIFLLDGDNTSERIVGPLSSKEVGPLISNSFFSHNYER